MALPLPADGDTSWGSTMRAALTAINNLNDRGPLEGMTLYAYGHSYSASDAYNSGAGAAGRWVSRIAARKGMTLVTRAANGILMEQTCRDAIGGANTWVPNTRGLATLCCTYNNIDLYGNSAAAVEGYAQAVRAFLAATRAKARVAASSTAFTYSAGWTSSYVSKVLVTNRWQTTTVGSYVEFKVTGDAVDILLSLVAAGSGTYTITSDGSTVATATRTAAVATDYTPTAVAVVGLGAGTHTIRVTLTSGSYLGIDGYYIPSETPPPVLAFGEGVVLSWHGSNVATYNGYLTNLWLPALAAVVAEFPHAIYMSAGSGWDNTTMLRTDDVVAGGDKLIHPNDKGASYLATRALDLLVAAPWGNGLNSLGTLPTYTAPSPPTIPSGGQNGVGLGSGTVYAADTFDRTSSASNPGSTSTGTLAWTAATVAGGATPTWGIVGGTNLVGTAGSATEGILTVDTTHADGTIAATLTNAADESGTVFRAVDSSNFWLVWTKAGSPRTYTLLKRVSGSYTTVATSSTGPVIGDIVRVVLSGSSITVTVNGVTTLTATDSALATATKHGFRVAGTGSCTFDEFSHTA